jgi:hypothetical protein
MGIPTLEQLILAAEVLVTWGFWIIVYGAITMLIGLVIIVVLNMIANNKIKFIK